MMKRCTIFYFVLAFASGLSAQTIVNTKHNLSASGPGTIKATSESEVCIFCHTPHESTPQAPLWNRNNSGSVYALYSSSTLNALPGQPDGSSILCLSCHDGTIALGNIVSRDPIAFTGGTLVMPAGNSNLGTDLSNDHPVSFLFDATLASNDGQLKSPAALTTPIKLESGKVQCTACHDPHDNTNTPFLVSTSKASALCMSCHDRALWAGSTHKTSVSTWNGTAPNPWFHTNYTTVADNACESCHNPHNSGGKSRLLKYAQEENNCLDCHNGNVSAMNVQAQFAKTYRHEIYNYTGTHEPKENPVITARHVECEDCHNPHAVNNTTATAPNRRGNEIGVSGVNQSGIAVNEVSFSYEICYKCHAGNSWAPPDATTRLITQNNVRLEFDQSSVSFHPVTGIGKNTNVPSLISPNTVNTILYCSSCHASDGTGAPAGPHGSIYPQILKSQYLKQDGGTSGTGTIESATAYALCYSCHNRTWLMNADNSSNTFMYHKVHVQGQNTPCNTCHDPHGISSTQGNAINNAHLINFKSSVVKPAQTGVGPRYESISPGHGRCYLTCHGQDHSPKTY
jgi:predicted CXXCH cytochrome family protein